MEQVEEIFQVADGIIPSVAEKLCSYTPVEPKVIVPAVIVPALRRVPLMVAVAPVRINVLVPMSNLEPLFMVKLVETVEFPASVTLATLELAITRAL